MSSCRTILSNHQSCKASAQAANIAMTAPFQEQAESSDAPQEAALAASEHPAAVAANLDRAVSDFQAMEVDNARLRAQLAAYRVLEASRFDDPDAAVAGPGPSGAGSVTASMAAASSMAAQEQGAMQASAMMASVGEGLKTQSECSRPFSYLL